MEIKARVVADSLAPNGSRITTFELEYPRLILSEMNTHRQLSRNTASSRAIPVAKMIELIRNDKEGVIVHWGKNQSGMQANGELDGEARTNVQDAWNVAKDIACDLAEYMYSQGAHKQIVNRILEPFQTVKTIATATEWGNFFWLRAHCLSEDTEILTKNGWKNIGAVAKGEEVYSLNSDGKCEFAKVVNTVSHKSDGVGYAIKGQSTDLIMSEGHNVLHLDNGNMMVKSKAKDLLGLRVKVKKNQNVGRDVDESSTEYAKGYIHGFVLGNGWLVSRPQTGNYYVVACKGGNSSEVALEKYKACVAKVFPDNTINERETSCMEVHLYGKEPYEWFKAKISNSSITKTLPDKMYTLSFDRLNGLFDGLLHSDGNVLNRNGGVKFYTSSKAMADRFQELCLLIGYSCSVAVDDRIGIVSKGIDSNGKEYNITTKNLSYTCHVNYSRNEPLLKTPVTEVAYDGMFKCVTLDKNGTIYVRRNGKAVWTGNCEAQPEIQELARKMYAARAASTPINLEVGHWHTPYFEQGYWTPDSKYDRETALKVSSSCCAQVSYRKRDDSIEKAQQLYDRLVGASRKHSSAFEHCASPMNGQIGQLGVTHKDINGNLWSGNFKGWIQYRQLIWGHTLNGEWTPDMENQ